MHLARALLCLLFAVLSGPAAEAANGISICPITNGLLASLNPQNTGKKPDDATLGYVGTTDAIFLSAAELNGYLDGDPRLTFASNSTKFTPEIAACLKSFARIYALAQGKGAGTIAKGVTIRLIGHADATGDAKANFHLSYLRAEHGKAVLITALSGAKVPLPGFLPEGHGGADLWWCGVEGPWGTPASAETCSSFASSPTSLDKNLKQRNDRHLEIRVEAPLIAGPRLDLVRARIDGGSTTADLARLAAFESRPRYFPQGTTPLAPVQIALGEIVDAKDRSCWKSAIAWNDNLWLLVDPRNTAGNPDASKLEPANAYDPMRFDEARLHVRVRPVPLLLKNGVQKIRLIVELATGTVGPLIAGKPDAATLAAADSSTTKSKPGPATIKRRSLGLGVPEYWRVRLRIEKALADWADGIRDGDEEEKKAAKLAWASLKPCLDRLDGGPFDQDQFSVFAAGKVLRGLPRDFDGLLGTAHDFNRPARMFGLRPGNRLRFDYGQLSLLRGKDEEKQTIALLGGQKTYDLFAAPLAIRGLHSTEGSDPTDVRDNMIARAGPYSHQAITTNPLLQGLWSGQRKAEDPDGLPTPLNSSKGVFNLANPYAFERFLRGRIVNVFLPTFTAPSEDNGIKGPAENIINEANITSDDERAADSSRDPIFVAATSPAELASFYLDFKKTDLWLAEKGKSLCEVRHDASKEKWRTMCGFTRSDVVPTLLIPATLPSELDFFPIDTRVGSLMAQGRLASCFAQQKAVDDGEFQPFAPADRLPSTIVIAGLGPEFAPPLIYDGRDCRMLSLPVLGGSEYKW